MSKIHFVNTTGVSLNDRFTTISKTQVGFGGPTMLVEGPRSRSNSLSRSDANRQLIEHWDRAHALQSAMKAASLRPARRWLQRNTLALQMKRTMGKLTMGGIRRLQRSNSFADIATMNADRVELMQRGRGRTPSITSRLGVLRTAPRDRSISRGRSMSRGRSTSRGRGVSRGRSASRDRQRSLSRSNSQTNLRRAGSRGNLSRAGSLNNLSRAGSRNGLNNLSRAGSRNGLNNLSRAGSRNGLNSTRKTIGPNDARRRLIRNNQLAARGVTNGATARRGRSRSRSRVRGTPATAVAAQANGGRARSRSRSRKRAGSKVRASSVNSRLGANRTNEPVAARVGGGRVTKRSRSRRPGLANATAVGTRTGRPLKRETPNRKGAGGKKAMGANNGANGAVAAGRRGRSRSRRPNSNVRGRSASKNRSTHVKQQPKSREELDNELDQYMANTKSSLDREMDQYMNGIEHSRI
ncbi:serine/arginine repetitive matrix protein 2-like [Anopheles nili]|uniref:serine/arginine repetitive matrix protein 2-like n=1 Tax=Anopheles nili TaxID=185578 RepID=UPI00237A48CD|nr:serine/arginine repetitive matrix protein 2-like [Anopheles nili]